MLRQFECLDDTWLRSIHGPFNAVSVRQGENIKATLVGVDDVNFHCDVWRLSPQGLELVTQKLPQFQIGSHVSLNITIGPQTVQHTGTVLGILEDHPKGVLVGISFPPSYTQPKADLGTTTRKSTRWSTHSDFFPVGTIKNPARFNDSIFFCIRNISRDGALVETSLRNKFILPGHVWNGSIDLPNADKIKFSAKVAFVRVTQAGGKNKQCVGLAFIGLNKKSLYKIGQYILNFASGDKELPSPVNLKKEGFGNIALESAVDFDYVRTEEDYRQVLELRSKAFQAVDGLGVTSTPEEMSDRYDTKSRIIIARFRDKIVATMRLVFHEKDDVFEEEQYTKFPDDLPPRDQIVEASRAATHPDYRGTDLFINMVRFSMLTILQSKRRWSIQSTYAALVPVYVRIGFKEMNMRVPHPVFPGEELHLLIAEPYDVLVGRKGSPLTFQALVPHIEQFLESATFSQLKFTERLRLKIWRNSAPILALAQKAARARGRVKRKLRLTK